MRNRPSWIKNSTQVALAIWWFEKTTSSKGGRWFVGRQKIIGGSTGNFVNRVSPLPYVGNGTDWEYADPDVDDTIPNTDNRGSVRTQIETTINNDWLDSNFNLLSNRGFVVGEENEIDVKCIGKCKVIV